MEPGKRVSQEGIKKKSPGQNRRYSAEFKLQIVKKYLEESLPVSVIRQECGISEESIRQWVHRYRYHGEAGLSPNYTGKVKMLKMGPGLFSCHFLSMKELQER